MTLRLNFPKSFINKHYHASNYKDVARALVTYYHQSSFNTYYPYVLNLFEKARNKQVLLGTLKPAQHVIINNALLLGSIKTPANNAGDFYTKKRKFKCHDDDSQRDTSRRGKGGKLKYPNRFK